MAEEDRELPPQAVAALALGNKIEAIKIVRETRNVGLKDAKETVEAYIRREPALQQKLAAAQAETKRASFRWVIVLAGIAIAVYYLLLSS
jgi:ribosomal protein L7/L12